MSTSPPRRAPLPSAPSAPQAPALLTELQSEVSVEAAPLLQFMIKHAVLIAALLLLFVAVLAGTASYNWYTNRTAHKAQADLARLIMSTQGLDRVKALELFAAQAAPSIRTAALLALADAATAHEDFALAAHAFAQVAANDTTGAVGLLAGLNQGQALLRTGDAVQAVTVLEGVEARTPETQRTLVRQILAEAALAAKNPGRAQEAFEALAASSAGGEAEYYRHRARALKIAPTAP